MRALARFTGQGPVLSVYLDVDGRKNIRPIDYQREFDRLVRDAGPAIKDVAADLARVEARVKDGIDRSRTRGLALYSADGDGLWEVIELPVPVRNQLAVGPTPHVVQLERVIEEGERFGVLLADRQRARMFVFELGELVDKSELFDQLPRGEDEPGDRDRSGHARNHVAAAAQHHLRRAAEVAFAVFQQETFHHLVIGAPDDIANALERELHSYLQQRIAARIAVPVNAREDDIRAAALQVEAEIERRKEAGVVERLRSAVGGNDGGVAGLDPVLQALLERRVAMLVVSDGYEAAGWRCPSCRGLAARGKRCPTCGAEMDKVDDVVEAAVEEAVNQSCRVQVCVGNADLDVLGRIGALLRF